MPAAPRALEGVLVSHPGVQHSRQLVRALHEGGLLARFVTSIDVRVGPQAWLPASVRGALRSRAVEGVPRSLVTTFPSHELRSLALRPLLGQRRYERSLYAGMDRFDRRAAAMVRAVRPCIVVGFENGCRHAFEAARGIGALCVLDAASVHYGAQSADDRVADRELLAELDARKERELRLADRVVVLSAHARDTYTRAGIPAERLAIIRPGAWFPPMAARSDHEAEEVRFLFVGNVKAAKGVDLLLHAFASLHDVRKTLTLVGPVVEDGLLPRPARADVRVRGKLAREALAAEYASADVLVMPSRGEGYGLVVAEAMASGLPAIVSSATGAKDLVRDGENGWVFAAGDAVDLARAMRRACERRPELPRIGQAASETARRCTWERYGEAVRDFYRGLLRP